MTTLRVDFDRLDLGDDQTMQLDGVPFTGTAFENWPNGELRCESQFLRGVLSGTEREWSERGILLREGTYWRGSGHGVFREWHPDGSLLSEIWFELGVRVAERNGTEPPWRLNMDSENGRRLLVLRSAYPDAPPASASR